MEPIKEWFSGIWGKVVAAVTIVFGILWYVLNLRGKKINALEAKLDLVDTQKKADLLEVEIKQKLAEQGVLKKEQEEHERLLTQLEEKRKNIAAEQKNKTPSQVEEYWNK